METNELGRAAKPLGSNVWPEAGSDWNELPLILPTPKRIPPMPPVKPPKLPTNGTSEQKGAQPPPEK
jgi:hypothetical protein